MYVVAKTPLDVTSGLQWLVVTHNSHSVKSKYSAMKVRQGHIVCSNPSKLALNILLSVDYVCIWGTLFSYGIDLNLQTH